MEWRRMVRKGTRCQLPHDGGVGKLEGSIAHLMSSSVWP